MTTTSQRPRRRVRPPSRLPLPLCLCLALVTALAALTACTGVSGTRAGGEAPPVTLTIGTPDPRGRLGSDQVEELARQVAELSGGRLELEPVFEAAGEGSPTGWDQQVAGQVVSGELALGMIPARAWDTEGVDTLRALHAPFLVTDDAMLDAVVTDDELVADLLAGLDGTGVRGLALLPEGLRHLFLFDTTEPTPEAVAGAVIRAPRSDVAWATLEALGARPTDREFDDGTGGTESEFALAGTFPRASSVVGNLTLFPKANTVVVNDEVLGELSAEHREVLRTAARGTRDWAVASLPDDAARAVEYCRLDGTVVVANRAELARWRAGVAPVLTGLRADPATADLIDRIAALPVLAAAPPVRGCSADAPLAENIEPRGGNLPDGTYRVEFTDRYLASQGLGPEDVANNHGVWTIELADGYWSVHQVADDLEDHWSGYYQVDGDRLLWRLDERAYAAVRWQARGDGSLVFDAFEGHDDARFHFGLAWRRVG